MAKTLLVPLSGDSGGVREAAERLLRPDELAVFRLAELRNGGRSVLLAGGFDCLALAGAPPADELGYGLAPLLALAVRPAEVALVDLRSQEVATTRLGRFVARTAPFALGQLGVSAAATALQRAAIPLASRRTGRRHCASELGRLLYLRPFVGSEAATGGSVTHTHEVIRALRASRVEVDAVTTDSAIADTARTDPDPPCEWRVVRAPRLTKGLPASAAFGVDMAILRAGRAAARNTDVIYQRHARFSLAGALLARITGAPLFLEYNGPEDFIGKEWTPTPLRRHLAACERTALSAADRIVVVSEVGRRALVRRGVEPERIVLNPNAVDASRFGVGGAGEVRARHGIAADDLVVGFVGTFGPWHGAPRLARAFVEAAGELAGLHLLLVGDGPEHDVAARIVAEAGFGERMTSVGPVAPSEVPAYLDAADVLASPHVPLADGVEFFGSPTKLYEYMAAGKAIVASRLGQIGDVLRDGETALLVEPGDERELADALRTLAASPRLRAQLGAESRRQAVERHGWRANARRIVDAYRTVARERGA